MDTQTNCAKIQRPYFYSLDTFRGIAALLVAYMHVQIYGIYWAKAWYCVDFFFILSGFILQYKYFCPVMPDDKSFLHKFVSHRIARLYPLHIAVLFLILLEWLWVGYVPPLNQGRGTVPFDLLQSVFMIQGMGFSLGNNPVNPSSWSIGTEFWANILFACLFIQKGFFIRISIAFLAYLFLVNSCRTIDVTGFPALYFISTGFLRTIGGFFLGTILYDIYAFIRSKWIPRLFFLSVCELASLASLILFAYITRNTNLYGIDVCYIILFCTAIIIFSFDSGILSYFFKKFKIYYIGYFSYSIYMIHYVLFWTLRDIFNIINPDKKSSFFLFTLILLFFSALIYYAFEKPAAKYYRNCISDITEFSSKEKAIMYRLISIFVISFFFFFIFIYKQSGLQ